MKKLTINRRSFIKGMGFVAGSVAIGSYGSLVPNASATGKGFVEKRQASVYNADAKVYKIRKSQDNPMVKKIYDHKDGFLHDGPCGHMSHRLLHTHYIDRSARVKNLKEKGFKFLI